MITVYQSTTHPDVVLIRQGDGTLAPLSKKTWWNDQDMVIGVARKSGFNSSGKFETCVGAILQEHEDDNV